MNQLFPFFAFSLLPTAALAAPGDVLTTLDAPGCHPVGLTWDGSALWVSNISSAGCTDPNGDDYAVERVSVPSGDVIRRFEYTRRVHHGLAWRDGLFAQVGWSDVFAYDAVSGAEIASFEDALSGFPTGLAYDPAADVLYVSEVQASVIHVVDPDSGAVLATREIAVPAVGNQDLAWDGCALWLANSRDDALYRIDPNTGVVLDTLDAPGSSAAGLAFDGTSLWVSDTSTDRIYEVEIAAACNLADSDNDGVWDGVDVCPDTPDPGQSDSDGDSIGDACDACEAGDDRVDTDDDGTADACDVCPDADDSMDADQDGVPDACDICPAGSDSEDPDGDGVPTACDVCPAGNDRADSDSDTVPNACDECPGGDDRVDTDGDGTPDACDACDGHDGADTDGDGLPDDCDPCPTGHQSDDDDSDGVANTCDICPFGDDKSDVDGDGVPDDCDDCAFGPDTDDADGDGIPDACDLDDPSGEDGEDRPAWDQVGCGCATAAPAPGAAGAIALLALCAGRRRRVLSRI